MGEIIFKTELIKGAKGDRGEVGQADSIPTDGVIAFQGETVPDGYEETDPGDVFDEVYEDINAVKDMISDEYDTTATYNAGNYCIHENGLYKCIATTTGLWDSSKWVLTSASDETKANASAIEAIVNEYGAKNKMNTGAARTYSSGKGFDVTINADGSVTLSGGVATGAWGEGFNAFYIDEDMILTGCPSQSGEDFKLDFTDFGGHTFNDYGEGVDIPYSASYASNLFYSRIWVNQGADFTTPKTFYPMIRDARIKDSTYVPYSMTNRELTERKQNKLESKLIIFERNFTSKDTQLFTQSDILTQGNISSVTPVLILMIAVQAKYSWIEVDATTFYDVTTNKWGAYNRGTGGDCWFEFEVLYYN